MNYEKYVGEFTDNSYLYWFKSLIPDILERAMNAPGEISRVQDIIDVFANLRPFLKKAVHLPDNRKLYKNYISNLQIMINDSLTALSVKVEENLMIQSHHFYTLARLKKPDPFDKYEVPIVKILKLKRVNIAGEVIDIKE